MRHEESESPSRRGGGLFVFPGPRRRPGPPDLSHRRSYGSEVVSASGWSRSMDFSAWS